MMWKGLGRFGGGRAGHGGLLRLLGAKHMNLQTHFDMALTCVGLRCKSRDILLQPLLPIVLGKAAGDTAFHNPLQRKKSAFPSIDHKKTQQESLSYIKQHSRCHMNTRQAARFGQKLDIVGDLVPAVQTSVGARLVRDLEQVVDCFLVDADAAG